MAKPRDPLRDVPIPEVGLCSACLHRLEQTSAKGQQFWRCKRADTDSSFRRYPPLPVTDCEGFEKGAATHLA